MRAKEILHWHYIAPKVSRLKHGMEIEKLHKRLALSDFHYFIANGMVEAERGSSVKLKRLT
jgi:hypothetical protein